MNLLNVLKLTAFASLLLFCDALQNDEENSRSSSSYSVPLTPLLTRLRLHISQPTMQFVKWFNLNSFETKKKVGCMKALQIISGKNSLDNTMIVNHFRNALSQLNTMMNGRMNELNSFTSSCGSLLDQELVLECNYILNERKSDVMQLLKGGKSNDVICTELLESKKKDDENLMLVMVQEKAIKASGSLSENAMSSLDNVESISSPTSCVFCKSVVKMVDLAINQDFEKVQEVRELIGDMCDTMPSDTWCHVVINRYDEIVKWLKEGSDPAFICGKISLCGPSEQSVKQIETALSSPTSISSISSMSLSSRPSDKIKNEHGCIYCTAITSIIKFVDENQKDQLDNVKTVLKYACKLAPKDCQCSEMENNFDEIVKLVNDGKEPHDICETIGICKKNSLGKAANALSVLSSTFGPGVEAGSNNCLYCDSVTTLAQLILEEEPDEVDQFRSYADMICNILGKDNACHLYIQQLDTVIDDLKQGKHPRDICVSLKYCTKIDTSSNVSKMNKMESTFSTSCLFCDIIGEFLSSASVMKNELSVKRAISAMCVVLPPDARCDILTANFDELIRFLQKGEDVSASCHQIGMCSATGVELNGLNREKLSTILFPLKEFLPQQKAQTEKKVKKISEKSMIMRP